MGSIRLYYSYEDGDASLREELERQLAPLMRPGLISGWHRGQLVPGQDHEVESSRQLAGSELILLFISPGYLASERCRAELTAALTRHTAGEATAVPVIVRACLWQETPLRTLQPLPRGGKPVTSWPRRDPVWSEVASEIRSLLTRDSGSVAKRAPLANLPQERNRFFTGRDAVVTRLHGEFTSERRVAVTPVQAITGLGGVGKTQTALEYAYRYRDEYQALFFLTAESDVTLRQGIAEAARLLQLPAGILGSEAESAAALLRWLKENSRWLLILDNVEQAPPLRPWVAHGGDGHVLVTSRHRNLQELGIVAPVELTALPTTDAVAFFSRRTGRAALCDSERGAAKTLSQELGGLPLALEQAGAYMVAKQALFASYLEAYLQQRFEILDREMPRFGHYTQSITTTWNLNLEAVAEKSPGSMVILFVGAFLHFEHIPLELLEVDANESGASEKGGLAAPFGQGPLHLDELLEPLIDYSLIRRDPERRTYSIHNLVQEFIRHQIPDFLSRDFVKFTLLRLLQCFPHFIDHTVHSKCSRLINHILFLSQFIEKYDIRDPIVAALFNQAAVYLCECRHHEDALRILNIAVLVLQKLDFKDPLIAKLSVNVALCHGQLGREEEARSILQNSLEQVTLAKGRDCAEVALILNNLALYQSNDREKERLLRESLDLRKRILQSDHPDVAQSLNNLAQVYSARGEHQRAEQLHLEALAIREAKIGMMDPLTGINYHHLGILHKSLHQYAKAEQWFRRALLAMEGTLEADHPDIATCLAELSAVCRHQSRTSEAVTALERAAAIREARFGLSNKDTIKLNCSLAELYRHSSQFDKAQEILDRICEFLSQSAGPDHEPLIEVLRQYGFLEKARGQNEKAREKFLRCVQILERGKGTQHPDIADPLNELAVLAAQDEDYAQAEYLHDRGIRILEKACGLDSPQLVSHLNNLALIHMLQKNLDAALSIHERSLQIRVNTWGDDPRTATCLSNMALIYDQKKQLKLAEECYSRSLNIRERFLQKHHPDTIGGMHLLGMHYLRRKSHLKANSLLDEALTLAKEHIGDESEQFARQITDQINAYLALKRYSRAEPLLRRLLEIAERVAGKDDQVTQRISQRLAEVAAKLKRSPAPGPSRTPPRR